MYQLFVILAVVFAVLLTLIVLVQESKGGGLAADFSNMNALAGVRRTTDLVEKLTWGFAVALVVLCVATSFVAPQEQKSTSVISDIKLPAAATQQQAAPAQQEAPAQQATPAEEAPAK